MRKLMILALSAIVVGGAQAAEPSEGTLTTESGPLQFTGGPFVAANVFGQAGDPECGYDPVFPCDFYALTISLPEDYKEQYPSALIRMSFAVDSPGANVREDYDIYLYDENGNLVAEGVSESDPEFIVQVARSGETFYEIAVVPFTATGSTYLATIELDPGEAAFGDEEAEDGGESRNLELAQSGGALGGLILLLGLAGLRRKV